MTIKGIHVWGDSLFRGILYDEKRNRHVMAPDSPVDLAARKIGLPVKNHARMGSTVVNGYKSLTMVKGEQLKDQIALLEFGGNDCDFDWEAVAKNPFSEHTCHVPTEEYRDTLVKMIDLIKETGGIPVLTTLPPLNAELYFRWIVRGGVDGNRLLSFLCDVQQIYRWQEYYSLINLQIAREEDVFCLPLREYFLSQWPYRQWLCEDGIHPNEHGYRLIVEVFLAQWAQYANRT